MKKSIITFGIALLSVLGIVEVSASNSSNSQLSIAYDNPTPLCMAISKGDFEIVKKFIEYGANVNERSNGLTPLMIAVRYNRVEIVKHLLDNGAKLDEKSDNGFTALKWAEAAGSTESIALIKAKAKA
ncbi:ankyrin repeat domain-containing protein [Flavobacterium silvaticum]|uniref:Ankyrin repeat domain-containing protein n=1 Tax=Flavobacterium silvaticum TaxID=1852020 RepID=A0A972FIX9_9FLAO|nr:ankyrin repeat domain-containing protein [Flavobacterium silvaticum]NMH26874.1 ankyrin repeat domain-containing protein [Flavobacterium silvaticum]